jgi:NAD(P)-dependent dehydrogenase (short-subunit alcohol dehydrogenase family)
MKGTTKVPDDFREKVVLVTGAGSGIGREAAQAFAARGGLIYGADLNERGLAETKDLIERAGGSVRVMCVDVSEEKEVAAFLARINKETGRLDVAFNNAGITGGAHRIEDYPTSDFEKVLQVNLRSVFLGMKYELPMMKRGGGGAICNTASVAALRGPRGPAKRSSGCGCLVVLLRGQLCLRTNAGRGWRHDNRGI